MQNGIKKTWAGGTVRYWGLGLGGQYGGSLASCAFFGWFVLFTSSYDTSGYFFSSLHFICYEFGGGIWDWRLGGTTGEVVGANG